MQLRDDTVGDEPAQVAPVFFCLGVDRVFGGQRGKVAAGLELGHDLAGKRLIGDDDMADVDLLGLRIDLLGGEEGIEQQRIGDHLLKCAVGQTVGLEEGGPIGVTAAVHDPRLLLVDGGLQLRLVDGDPPLSGQLPQQDTVGRLFQCVILELPQPLLHGRVGPVDVVLLANAIQRLPQRCLIVIPGDLLAVDPGQDRAFHAPDMVERLLDLGGRTDRRWLHRLRREGRRIGGLRRRRRCGGCAAA